jgi:uncharacterized repeat protein (TIGR03943 family)
MQATEHLHDSHNHHEHEHHHDHEHEQGVRRQAWLKTGLLLGLGAYFIYIIVTGNLTNYINQRFAWLSVVAAGLFVVMGVVSLLDMRRGGAHDHHHEHDHDHAHSRLPWLTLAVVAVPLILGVLIPSRPLASAAVGSISTNVAASANTQTVTLTSNPLEWNVLDWLRAFHNSGDLTGFNGKQADVVGFVYREASFGKNQFMVSRFTVSCCVADASAIGLPVAWDQAGDFPQDTWVRVKGSLQVGEFRGDSVPILRAASVEKVAQPTHPYLYP